jgi:hypothetical protein
MTTTSNAPGSETLGRHLTHATNMRTFMEMPMIVADNTPHVQHNAQDAARTAPPFLTHQARLAADQACLEAALTFLSYGIAPTCCCDPDHIAVGTQHGKKCDYPGKAPMHKWKTLQTQLPTAEEVHAAWRDYSIGNVGIVLGQGSGVVRIDSDGAVGAALLHEWSGGDLPPTWAFASPSGGQGWLYRWDKDVPCQTTATAQHGTTHEELRLMGNGSQTIVGFPQ